MYSEVKLIAVIILLLVGGCSATVGLSYNGEKNIVKEGMEQQVMTYCDSYSTKTVWVKSK